MARFAMTPEATRYYALGLEAARLFRPGDGELERLRTQEILTRVLPRAPSVVVDVGGAAGVHALWLASLGHEVHLVDAAPLHVEQARQASATAARPLASAELGDARSLRRPDASADVVLLLGPLYHLMERSERIAALAEAGRVVRRDGVVVAATISRFAPALVATNLGRIGNAGFRELAGRALREGVHSPPADMPAWFTRAWFHAPGEIAEEIAEAGLRHESTVAVEGPAWMSPTLADDLADPERRAALLDMLRRLESEPALLGSSAHALSIARRG